MPQRLKKTEIHRNAKSKKFGRKSKAAKNNKGTTPSIPLTGALPATRFGFVVAADSIATPSSK